MKTVCKVTVGQRYWLLMCDNVSK